MTQQERLRQQRLERHRLRRARRRAHLRRTAAGRQTMARAVAGPFVPPVPAHPSGLMVLLAGIRRAVERFREGGQR